MKNKLKKIALLLGDITLFYFALFLGLGLRYQQIPNIENWQRHLPAFSVLLVIWFMVFYISGLYDLSSTGEKKLLRQSLKSFFASFLLSIIYFYTIPTSQITPKTNLISFVLVYFILFIAWRKIFYRVLKSYLPKNRIAIIGFNHQVKNLIKEIRNQPHLGYNIIFILDPKEREEKKENIPVFRNLSELKSIIKGKKINTIIVPDNIHSSQEIRSALFPCLPLKINIYPLSKFYEDITGKIPVDIINQMWFLENLSEGRKNRFDKFKRIYDFAFALILLVITLPFWLLIALAIKIDSKGGVFFRQIRVGERGKEFTIIKFRTMTTENNDHSLTREKDDRITRVGNFLRKTRLDEPPQLLNIIKGEMSFIGPRPERPEFVKNLEKDIPFYRERMLIKPGLTGWDQVSGEYHSPTTEDTLKKLQYDLFYIKNRSLYLDLSIILKTITTVLSSSGR